MESQPEHHVGAFSRGFFLCLLFFAQGSAVAFAVASFTSGPLLKMSGSGVAAAGAGVVIEEMILALGVLAAVAMSALSGLMLRRTAKELSLPAAALALNAFQVGHLADHFSWTLFGSLAAGTASILLVWALPGRFRTWASPVLIGAALVSIEIPRVQEREERADENRATQIRYTIEEHAESRNDEALRRDLDALHEPVDLVFVLEVLVIRGDYLPQIDTIVNHPRTPSNQCIQVLRGERDFSGFTGNGNARYTEICAGLATVLGARWDRPKILAAGIAQLGSDGIIGEPLFSLARVDTPAALRMLRAANLLDSRGKVDPRHYNAAFIAEVWNRLDTTEGKKFIFDQMDLGALLVATLWSRGDLAHPAELLKTGANPNYRSACGATPLTTLLTGAIDKETLKLLIQSGADPDLPGAERCLGEGSGTPVLKRPLDLLLERSKTTTVDDEEMVEWRRILGR
jgi:hypothetical protein